MTPTCVVVIPIHSAEPSANELYSFAQCFKILYQHPIRVVAPKNLILQKYKEAVAEFEVIYIEKQWLSSLRQYNLLKISRYFYSLFKQYDFLLTYELDAFVFRDEVAQWCNKGYDYIGAPWFEGWYKGISTNIIGVGNSGFSLRSVQSSLRILRCIQVLKNLRSFWFKSHLQAAWRFSKMIVRCKNFLKMRSTKDLDLILLDYPVNEDYFWSHLVTSVFNDYKVAPVKEAIRFSFDVHPAFLYKQNNNELPFGCHGWVKYQPEFWKSFIPFQFNLANK